MQRIRIDREEQQQNDAHLRYCCAGLPKPPIVPRPQAHRTVMSNLKWLAGACEAGRSPVFAHKNVHSINDNAGAQNKPGLQHAVNIMEKFKHERRRAWGSSGRSDRPLRAMVPTFSFSPHATLHGEEADGVEAVNR